MISIMYQNVAGSNAILEGLVSGFSYVDVFVIGEVPQWAGECRKMKGMYFVGKDGEGKSIVGLYVRERAIGALIIEEVEKHWICFRIRRREGEIGVVGIYVPADMEWAKREEGWEDVRKKGSLIIGDTNARHAAWDPWMKKSERPNRTERRGMALENAMRKAGWRNLCENLVTREGVRDGRVERSCLDHVWTGETTSAKTWTSAPCARST